MFNHAVSLWYTSCKYDTPTEKKQLNSWNIKVDNTFSLLQTNCAHTYNLQVQNKEATEGCFKSTPICCTCWTSSTFTTFNIYRYKLIHKQISSTNYIFHRHLFVIAYKEMLKNKHKVTPFQPLQLVKITNSVCPIKTDLANPLK